MNVIFSSSGVSLLLRARLMLVAGLLCLVSAAIADSANEAVHQVMPLTVERTDGNEEPGAVVDTITHTSIEIERPPAAVWPHILDSNAWTKLSLMPREGPAGEVGEIFALVDPTNPGRIRTVFAKNLELVPEQRRTFKIYDRTGRRSGYVTWTLQKIGARTLVLYDIYYQEFLPRQQMPPGSNHSTDAQWQERQNAMREGNHAELLQLKKFVELNSTPHETVRPAS